MGRRKLSIFDTSSSEPDITGGQPFHGELHDSRTLAPYWSGPEGPLVMGSWGWPGDVWFVPLSSVGLPCPVCRVLGGFHDRDQHDSKRAVPTDKLIIKPERINENGCPSREYRHRPLAGAEVG